MDDTKGDFKLLLQINTAADNIKYTELHTEYTELQRTSA